VKLGEAAPNSKVVKVPGISGCHWSRADGKTTDECRLLDFEASDRPLVVNFGSAS
ncbi:type II iodothyronine deiodinase, partial [Tachysurus ichikawai]